VKINIHEQAITFGGRKSPKAQGAINQRLSMKLGNGFQKSISYNLLRQNSCECFENLPKITDLQSSECLGKKPT